MVFVGSTDGQSYNTIPRVMGNEMLCLRGISPNSTQSLGGFIIPNSVSLNDRALYYEVIKVGSDVETISDVHVGDFVFVDALARFADTYPISFINCRNVITKTDANGSMMSPVKYKIIVKVTDPSQELDKQSGFIKTNDIDPYGEVIGIGAGCENRGFSVGDRVSITSDAGVFFFKGEKYFIYDWRSPLFKFSK